MEDSDNEQWGDLDADSSSISDVFHNRSQSSISNLSFEEAKLEMYTGQSQGDD